MKLTINKQSIFESIQLFEEWDRPIGSGLSKQNPEDINARNKLASQIKASRAQSKIFSDHKINDRPGFNQHNKKMDNYKNYHNNFASLLSQKNGAVQNIDKIQQKNPEHAQKVLNTLGESPRLIPSYNATNNAQIRSRVNAGLEPLTKMGTDGIHIPKNKLNKGIIMEKTKGTYVGVDFSESTVDLFKDILKEFGLTKDFDDKFHCTLVYSKKKLNWFKTSLGDTQTSEVNKLVKIKGFGHFNTAEGKNLHVILECDYCEAEFQRAKKLGATFDYDKYVPHVTLMYDCKDFTYDNQGEKFIGKKVLIVNEYIDELNENWLEDATIDNNDGDDGDADLIPQKKDYDCGVASVATILEKFDIETISYLKLQKKLKTTISTGTPPNTISKFLKSKKIMIKRVLEYKDDIKGYALVNITKLNKKDIPEDDQNGHWVYFETKNDKVLMYDVYTDKKTEFLFNDFKKLTNDIKIKNELYNNLIYSVSKKINNKGN